MKFKVYETQLIAYNPKKVQSLGMREDGFPLVNGEPQDMDDNTIFVLFDSILFILA